MGGFPTYSLVRAGESAVLMMIADLAIDATVHEQQDVHRDPATVARDPPRYQPLRSDDAAV